MQESFDEVLKEAEKQLSQQDQFFENEDTEAVYVLAKFANDSSCRLQIIEFIKKAFDALRHDAKKRFEMGKVPYVLVNNMIYGAVGRLAGMIEEKSLASLIYNEFKFAMDDEQNYEMNLEAGTLAITLSLLGYDGETKAFDEFLTSYEYRYQGEEFVMEVRYSDWLIRKDKTEPIEYLKNPVNVVKKFLVDVKVDENYIRQYGDDYKRSLGFVAATLADLNAKESLSILRETLVQIKNPVTLEVFKEAIRRIETQATAPAPKDRMIWMFGKRSSTEIVLGHEADNEFLLRAKEQTKNENLGNIIEADESATNDL